MLCQFCGKNEAIVEIANVKLCQQCEEDTEYNFFVICQKCGSYWKILRSKQSIEYLLRIQIMSEMIFMAKEVYRFKIEEIERQQPIFFFTIICPFCQEGEEYTPKQKIVG